MRKPTKGSGLFFPPHKADTRRLFCFDPLSRAPYTFFDFTRIQMNQSHDPSFFVSTYLRLLVLMAVSIVMVVFIPFYAAQSDDLLTYFTNQLVNMGILYAIIVGFLMSITLTRKQALEESVTLELNKIRRIYHLAFHIQRAEPKLHAWYDGLLRAFHEYLGFFCKKSFAKYEEGNEIFRKITYAIYGLPALNIPYNSELYEYLLDATSSVTEARESIRAKKDSTIGMFQWLVIVLVTMILSAMVAATTPWDLISRYVSTIVIFCLFLVLDLLYEYDQEYQRTDRYLAEFYANNLPQLAICERPKKRGLKKPLSVQKTDHAPRAETKPAPPPKKAK
jgi:hypothetical protein